jgi:DNA-directed RNA polymerase specialized sigma24 family protein
VQRAIGEWKHDPAKGRFRFWLARIAQNAIINVLTRRPPDVAMGGTMIGDLLAEQPEPDHRMQQSLQTEYRRSLFRWAAQRILPEFHDGTWEAFWMTTVEGMRAEEAAQALGKSLGAVYAARSRVMRRLKEEIQQSGFDGRE